VAEHHRAVPEHDQGRTIDGGGSHGALHPAGQGLGVGLWRQGFRGDRAGPSGQPLGQDPAPELDPVDAARGVPIHPGEGARGQRPHLVALEHSAAVGVEPRADPGEPGVPQEPGCQRQQRDDRDQGRAAGNRADASQDASSTGPGPGCRKRLSKMEPGPPAHARLRIP
jgi:hypothetical protein